MGLEDMTSRIEQEAQKEADAIIEEARREAEKIKKKASRETQKEILEKEGRLQKEANSRTNIILSEGRRKSRQAILTAKEDLIWDAMARIRERLSSMGQDELRTFLDPYFEKARGSLGEDLLIFPVRDIDARALKEKGNIKASLAQTDEVPEPLSHYASRDLLGGFLAASPDRRRMMNMTFQGILEKNEDSIRETIAKRLFGE